MPYSLYENCYEKCIQATVRCTKNSKTISFISLATVLFTRKLFIRLISQTPGIRDITYVYGMRYLSLFMLAITQQQLSS